MHILMQKHTNARFLANDLTRFLAGRPAQFSHTLDETNVNICCENVSVVHQIESQQLKLILK